MAASFVDNSYRCIVMTGMFSIFIQIWLNFVVKGTIDNKSELAQVMCWCQQVWSLYMNWCWHISLPYIPLVYWASVSCQKLMWRTDNDPCSNVKNIAVWIVNNGFGPYKACIGDMRVFAICFNIILIKKQKIHTDVYTVVSNITMMILHIAWQLQMWNMDHILNSHQTFHSSSSQMSYGMSILSNLKYVLPCTHGTSESGDGVSLLVSDSCALMVYLVVPSP